MRTALGLGMVVLAPIAAQAGDFTPPDGCTLEVTAQLASCTVAQYYRCEADAEGDQWVSYFTEDGGPTFISRIDSEARWMETIEVENGWIEYLGPEAIPASLSNLLDTGHDDYDFTTITDDGLHLRHKGHDRLTGEQRVIDGVDLLATEFELTTTLEDGEFLYSRKGGQYVSAAHGRFYGGREKWVDYTGAEGVSDDTPRSFARPGQPGFATTQPAYGCRMQMVDAGRQL